MFLVSLPFVFKFGISYAPAIRSQGYPFKMPGMCEYGAKTGANVTAASI